LFSSTAWRRRGYAAGAVVAAAAATAALVSNGVASAHSAAPAHPTAAVRTAAAAPAVKAPKRAGDIPNLGLVEDRIQAYYGDPNGTGVAGTHSNYAKQTRRITARTERFLARRLHHAGAHPALILDIDDTSLTTYGYEISEGFGYTPASNLAYLQSHTLPAVFGVKGLANWASRHKITVFWITGRPDTQQALTVANLTDVGYHAASNTSDIFLKPTSNPPAYLTCEPSCSTIQYKSQTRAHIASMGYRILADMGDQFSDLKGGHSGRTVKMPNPMYFIP
jgi:hypothetical protein